MVKRHTKIDDPDFRPICINHGCGKPVAYCHKDERGNKRWRIHCGHCQAASWGKWPHRQGVTPFKTGKCSNVDGHLTFTCATNWDQIPTWAKGLTEVDHKNGNHLDNRKRNLDELCMHCHKLKGILKGDFRGHRYKRG